MALPCRAASERHVLCHESVFIRGLNIRHKLALTGVLKLKTEIPFPGGS